MAEVRRQRDKIHSTICEHCIPERGTPGEIWIAKDTGSFWYVTVEGITVCLTDVLNNRCAHTPPRAGRDGVDGISVKGEPGPCGKDGRDGKDGKDGRDAIGIPGVQGISGLPGKDGRDAPDLSTLRAEWRQDLSAIRAENAELKLLLTAMIECNTKAGLYVAFLKEHTAKILQRGKQ